MPLPPSRITCLCRTLLEHRDWAIKVQGLHLIVRGEGSRGFNLPNNAHVTQGTDMCQCEWQEIVCLSNASNVSKRHLGFA
jgi:hypothetical protein